MLRLALAFSALCLPTFSAAQCLTAADLDNGINMEFGNGDISTMRNGENGTIVDIGQNESQSWVINSFGGVFEVDVKSRFTGYWTPSAYLIEYDFAVADLFPLQTGAVGGGVETYSDAETTDALIFSYSVHQGDDMEISGCTYQTQEVYLTRLANMSELSTMVLTYISDLGVGYVTSYKWYHETAGEYELVALTSNN